jgi:hypothetical protein
MSKKILENWKEIEKIEELAKEQTGDPKAGFNATTFWLNNDGRHLMIPVLFRGKKGKKGEEKFTNSYKELMVYAKFCPFSGKPLYEETTEEIEKK